VIVTQPANAPKDDSSVFILITQCLQNGFFLANDSRLCLPAESVRRMLVGNRPELKTGHDYLKAFEEPSDGHRRVIDEKILPGGPMYKFFELLTEGIPSNRELHIITIRDWHAPSRRYDDERQRYGIHCEADTWDAEPIEGMKDFLAPWSGDARATELARSLQGYSHPNNPKLHYYDIRSDTVFDFKRPEDDELRNNAGDHATLLEAILIKLIGDQLQTSRRRVYIGLIGVYTDIKIKLLLIGLRTRFEIDNLFVSDVLTTAPTLERHLEALDFFDKVLNVEIVHSLTDFARALIPSVSGFVPQSLTKDHVDFRDYRSYFLDKQRLLAFQDEKLLDYLEITSQRSTEVYNRIYNSNVILLRFGFLLLALTFIMVILMLFGVEVPEQAIWVTGGLSVVGIITSFFLVPSAQMRNNINTLVRLRNYLETYSTISGLLRYHLTKVEHMQPRLMDKDQREQAEKELALLEKQMDIIQKAAKAMSETFGADIPLPGQYRNQDSNEQNTTN
jgi:hypothetical protein